MSEIQILMLFIVVAVAFVWVSVSKVTAKKQRNKDDADFNTIVGSKLNTLYGVKSTVKGLTVVTLPAELKAAVDQYLNRK